MEGVKQYGFPDHLPAAFPGGILRLCALSEGMDSGGYEVVNCEGGCYVTYTYRDGDEQANNRLCQEAAAYIEFSEVLELDVRP